MHRLDTLTFALRKFKTSEHLCRALHAGAVAWVKGNNLPSVESLDLPDSPVGRLVAQAYSDQCSLGWNVLFRGFWARSWRLAQEAQFSSNRSRDRQDTGERWAAKVQNWGFDLFEVLWGLRNEHEHGADPETQKLIRLSKCERAIRRLYNQGLLLSIGERHPFRTDIDVLLAQSVRNQELWISKTEEYLPKAFKRMRNLARIRQPSITDFFTRLHG
jgi:hypothetical protein